MLNIVFVVMMMMMIMLLWMLVVYAAWECRFVGDDNTATRTVIAYR